MQLALALPQLGIPAARVSAFEFGAGADLVGPLTFWALGVSSQTIVDRTPLLSWSGARRATRILSSLSAELGLARLPASSPSSTRSLRDLGIDYRAPVDAVRTGLPAESMDLITSNSTLEHVPKGELAPLLLECSRLLKRDGVMCFRIDYEDHYAYFDPRISAYNFLRYSEEEWSRYNSSIHYQNRLRHRDYVELFGRVGLDVREVRTLEPELRGLAELALVPVHADFRGYATEELGTRKGTFVLGKASA